MTSVNRTGKDGTKKVPCPKAVDVYSDVMGRDNHVDQKKEKYRQVNKRRSYDQLTFRIKLACQLIHTQKKRTVVLLDSKQRSMWFRMMRA
ncbi:hypothetical protein TNCV_2429761 [Trichonephila clavipes]|nr:hypothetical protein TNCV_2429761 [Trichonephila clavipes]